MRRITIISAALATAALARYSQYSNTGYAPWYVAKDSSSVAGFADSARKADSARAAWKADSAHVAWFAHAATYADSSRASHISDSAKKIPGSTIYRYLMTQANGSVSAGSLIDSAGKLFAPESLVVGTQASAATVGVNSRNSVITGFYMMDANKKRWGMARGALSDSFLIRAYTPSEAVIDTPLAFGVNAGDSGRITRPFKFSAGLRVVGSLMATADSSRATGTATKLATPRTISMTGDGTWSASFDGSANATGALTLASLLTAGSAGSAASVPTLTWDAKGRLTAASSVSISIPHGQISDWGTYIDQPLLTTSSPTFGQASMGTMIGYPDNAWFGHSGLNSGTLYSGFYQVSGSDIGIAALSGHGIYLQVAQAQILDVTGNAIVAHVPISATTLTASGSISEGGTALSSKYLGINASIPSSRISDWSTYINQQMLTTSSPTFATVTANGGIIGQGNVGSSAQPWNAGYFSVAGIDIGGGLLTFSSPSASTALLGVTAHPISIATATGAIALPAGIDIDGGLLTFNSPSASTALLGVTAHPISIATATGAIALPAGIGLNGPLGLSVVSVGGTTYSATAHRGRILTIAPSTTFTLPLGSAGDWFIIQSSDVQGPGQSAGTITPSGTTVYIRGVAYSSLTSVIGTLVAYCNGVYWYIG